MKGICPNCEKETELELIQKVEDIKVRGEVIKVDVKYYKCKRCGEEFEDPRSDEDPLDKAYREYRRRHEMMQPEEVRDFRKRFGLTQNEMSRLLGWGGATLSRYENGALQDETHEKVLRLAMDPRNLLKLIEESPDALPKEKRDRLINELRAAEEETFSLEMIYEERFGKYEADELSGYRRLDLAKLFNAILYFCKGGVLKTKLNKLLFYADFKHFKDYAISITGARYAHIPFGPAPDKYALYFAALLENGAIDVKEYVYSEEVIGEEFISVKEPDLSLFSDSELKILATVKEHFKDFNVKKITDFSHDEEAYKKTAPGDIISYEYANELKL
ncbi:MAG: type II TA system antitoxin MqsA family protein [Thermodesulfobacteriota bacterium]